MECMEHKNCIKKMMKRDGRKGSSLYLFHGFHSSLALPFCTCLHTEKGVICFTYQAPQDTYPMCPHALLLTIPCHTEHCNITIFIPTFILHLKSLLFSTPPLPLHHYSHGNSHSHLRDNVKSS